MNKLALLLAFVPLALGGCGPALVGAGAADAAIIYATRPDTPPPADTEKQIPAHESWCYRTLGDVQCYTEAQDVNPEGLINVEPQSRYPLTAKAYRDEVAGRRNWKPATDDPIDLNNGNAVPVPPAPVTVEQAAPTEMAPPMATKKTTTIEKTTAKKATAKSCCKSKKK